MAADRQATALADPYGAWPGSGDEGDPAVAADEVQKRSAALGNFRRAGLTPESAARAAGVTGARFIPGNPITIRTGDEA